MSWIIQHLLSHKTEIKESSPIVEYEFRGVNPYGGLDPLESTTKGYIDPLIENDAYNNLLLVEKAIDELYEKGVLVDEDLSVLKSVQDGDFTFSDEPKGKQTMQKKFQALCERVAFYMGGYFTNDGFIEQLAKDNNLTVEEVSKIREFIQSKYRHQLKRRKN